MDRLTKQVAICEAILDVTLVVLLVFMVFKPGGPRLEQASGRDQPRRYRAIVDFYGEVLLELTTALGAALFVANGYALLRRPAPMPRPPPGSPPRGPARAARCASRSASPRPATWRRRRCSARCCSWCSGWRSRSPASPRLRALVTALTALVGGEDDGRPATIGFPDAAHRDDRGAAASRATRRLPRCRHGAGAPRRLRPARSLGRRDAGRPGRGARHGPPRRRGGHRGRRPDPHLPGARRRRRAGRGGARARGVAPGDVVSVQLPNWYETVVVALAVQGAVVVNPLLPNYRRREPPMSSRPRRPRRSSRPSSTALRPRLAHRRGCGRHGRRAAPRAGPATGRARVPSSTTCSTAPRRCSARPRPRPGVRADLHVGDRGQPEGDHAHRADRELQRAGGPRRPRAHRGRRRVDALARRPLDRLQLRAALRVVPRAAPRAARPLGRRHGRAPRPRLPRDLHAGRDDLPPGPRRGGARCGERLPELRCFGCGGARCPRAGARRSDVGVDVLRLYGSTEVLVATWNRPGSSPDQRANTDGIAMTDVEVELRDDAGRPVPVGEPGEIYVRGPNTCVGFFQDPERTAATFDQDGWVRSGDLAVVDAAGAMTVRGRKKEIIIRGGVNIAPREIEELLVGWPEVERAAVVGLPDPRLGERACACVALRARRGAHVRGAGDASPRPPGWPPTSCPSPSSSLDRAARRPRPGRCRSTRSCGCSPTSPLSAPSRDRPRGRRPRRAPRPRRRRDRGGAAAEPSGVPQRHRLGHRAGAGRGDHRGRGRLGGARLADHRRRAGLQQRG